MNTKSFLVVSLGLNLATLLLAAYFYRQAQAPRSGENPVPTAAAATSNAARVATAKPTPKTEPQTAQTIDWRRVESEDYKKYIGNLRSIGCPEETIRDIIIADVNKLFDSRKRELRGSKTNRFEYWKAGNPFVGLMDEEKLKQQQELAQEKRTLLKELLGVEPEEKFEMFGGFNPLEQMLDFLPGATQTQLMEIEQKFAARLMKRIGGGAPDAEDMKEMRKIQAEKEAEMAKLMTPEQKEEYDLRMSQTAMMMRFQLGGFEPSEQEFREIFKARKKFDDEFTFMGINSGQAENGDKRAAAQKDLDGRLKEILGEQRFTEYNRNQDWTYQGIAKVVERQGLPKDAAVKVFDMKKLAEEQAQKLRFDSTLSADRRSAALKAIADETQRSVREVLGEKGFESFKNQPAASWLQQLHNRGVPEAPAVPVPTVEVRP